MEEERLIINDEENQQLLLTDQDRKKLEIFKKYGISDKRRKIDLLIIIFISFMGMICYSVVLPSIALYLDDVSIFSRKSRIIGKIAKQL
jgi:hypothetical protein